jgi:hypothetical protein
MADDPTIGELKANIAGHGSIGTFDVRATISAKFERTGWTHEADAAHGEVDAWSRDLGLRSVPLFRRVRDALHECPTVSGETIVGFRGRTIPSRTPKRSDFGPPPPSVTPANRYNFSGAPALYLCTVREAVGRELPAVADVWVQRFEIPLADLRVVDLRSPKVRSDPLVGSVMWAADLAGDDGQPSQDFTRLVASIVAEAFDGMLLSGVRGDSTFLYSNLVLFRPGDTWPNWLSSELPSRL